MPIVSDHSGDGLFLSPKSPVEMMAPQKKVFCTNRVRLVGVPFSRNDLNIKAAFSICEQNTVELDEKIVANGITNLRCSILDWCLIHYRPIGNQTK